MSYAPPPGAPYGPPGPPPAAAQPTAAQPTARGLLLLAALAGFLVAAVIAGVLVAAGVFDDDDDDSGTSTAAISLPAKVDSFVRFADVTRNKNNDRAKAAVANSELVDTRTGQALSAAHGGAATDVQTYASQELDTTFQLWAVRAPTPAPVVPYQNPDYIGLAQPTTLVRKYGNSSCQLFATKQTPKGQTPPADAYIATGCVRSDAHLSVIYYGGGGNDFSTDPARIAKAIDEVWDALN